MDRAKVDETLTQAVADFLTTNRNAQGDTASSFQFMFETPEGDDPALYLDDDNPLLMSDDDDEDIDEDINEDSTNDEDIYEDITNDDISNDDDTINEDITNDEDVNEDSTNSPLFERLIAIWYCIIYSILLFMPLIMRSLCFYNYNRLDH